MLEREIARLEDAQFTGTRCIGLTKPIVFWGFGVLTSVCRYAYSTRGIVGYEFVTDANLDKGLVYVASRETPFLPDRCVHDLGSGWTVYRRIDDYNMRCPRGYEFTPGG